MTSKEWQKLEDPEYRKAYVAAQSSIGIPFQLRALLKERGWSQGDLAEASGMKQPQISRLLTAGGQTPNLGTLHRLATALDCGLIVRFAPFSEMVEWADRFDPDTFSVASFPNDSLPQQTGLRTVSISDALRKPAQREEDWPDYGSLPTEKRITKAYYRR